MSALALILVASLARAGDSRLEIGDLEVDGVQLASVSCQLQRGPFLAALAVTTSVTGRKEALDACAPAGAAFRVEWSFPADGAPTAAVKAGTAPEAVACVQGALQPGGQGVVGACTGILLVGDREAAKAAVARLPAR